MIGSTKYTWTFPSELKNIILSEIEYQGNPNFSVEITSQIPNHSMHDWTIVDYPFTFHKGSDGNWQGGVSYTIGLGTYSIPARDSDGVYYEMTNNHRAGVNYISNTNGTMVVFFAINETAHQAAIMYLMSAWYLSSDMNRIHLVGSGTNTTEYEQLYSDLLSAIPSNYTANGGGATHIAKRTGQLKDLSSYTSDILIVSGGGGGGYVVDGTAYAGADAGGISGSGSNSGNQSTGYAFGQGESGTNKSGGGAGYYGGYKGV